MLLLNPASDVFTTWLQFAKPLNRNGCYPRRDENISSGQAMRSPLNSDRPTPAPLEPRHRLNPYYRRYERARALITLMQIIH